MKYLAGLFAVCVAVVVCTSQSFATPPTRDFDEPVHQSGIGDDDAPTIDLGRQVDLARPAVPSRAASNQRLDAPNANPPKEPRAFVYRLASRISRLLTLFHSR